jgi:hypothetical protein
VVGLSVNLAEDTDGDVALVVCVVHGHAGMFGMSA